MENDDAAPATRRPLKSRDTAWARSLAGTLVRAKIGPNAISLAGILFAGLGAAAMAAGGGHPFILIAAAAAVQLRLLCNLMDGLVAVEGGLKSKAGALFNEAPDRLEDSLLLGAAGYASGIPWLGWLCVALALATAYLRAFGASLGLGQNFSGPGAKPHRMAVLTVGLIAQAAAAWSGAAFPALGAALGVIAALAAVTVARRTAWIYRGLP